jgi:membrane protein DedA with SNARE-associated domain
MQDSGLAAQLVHQFGYWGLGASLIVNCLGIPIASEVTLPLSGVLVRSGGFNLPLVFLVAFSSQMIGFTIAYFIARRGGVELLEKYGKYVFIKHKHIKKMHRLFQKHGVSLIFAGACIPGLHGYVGYPAGLAGMNFYLFELVAGLGTLIWTSALIGLGLLLYRNMGSIMAGVQSLGVAGGIVLVVLLGVAIWYIVRQIKEHRRR